MESDQILRKADPGESSIMITRDLLYLRVQALQRHMACNSIEQSQYIVQQTLEHLSSPTASQHVPHETIHAIHDLFQEIAVELLNIPIDKAILMQLTGAVLLLVDPY